MREFWNARAREDAFYFVDTRQRYRSADHERFWDGEEILGALLAGLGVGIAPGDTALEIGCGIGRITRALAARAGRVIALDVSDEMLARARELNGHLTNVNWELGDGRTLAAVGEESIDAAVSLVVLQHVPDPEITLGYVTELGRVLRPGAWAALQVSNDPATHRPRDRLIHRCLALVGRAPRGRRHPAWLGSHVEMPAVRATAEAAGLSVAKVWGEGDQYCQVLLRKPPRAAS
jgi:ubiquinone/menaquinone biosynthesis C-methylase UbiE